MKTRFIKSAVDTAKTTEVQMPWARGSRRAATVAKRKMTVELRRIA